MLIWRDDLVAHGFNLDARWRVDIINDQPFIQARDQQRRAAMSVLTTVLHQLDLDLTMLVDAESPLWSGFKATPLPLVHRNNVLEPILYAYGHSDGHQAWLQSLMEPSRPPGRPKNLAKAKWPRREVPSLDFEIEE